MILVALALAASSTPSASSPASAVPDGVAQAAPSAPAASAADAVPAHPYLLGAQATTVALAVPRFHASDGALFGPGTGASQTFTVFAGLRLLEGLDGYLEPEAATGSVPGQGAGLAGAPDGDLLGPSGRLDVYLARAFVRWRTGLGPERGAPDRLDRSRGLVEQGVPARRMVVTLGQLAVTDLLDQNRYAGSPRTQFLSVAFANDLAYDLPQDVHGYTRGALVSVVLPGLQARLASFATPERPGGPVAWLPLSSRSDALELTASPRLPWTGAERAALRVLAWREQARLGLYRDALAAAGASPPPLAAVRRHRARWGLAAGLELPLAHDGATGLFARAGWAQGAVEALSFAECDRTASAGAQLSGRGWGRPDDGAGLALAISAISARHRRYLADGGQGLRLAGPLRGGAETDAELYYALQVAKPLALSAHAQAIWNPGYDRARGPSLALALRAHLER